MQLKSDKQGFLVGELISKQDDLLDAQEASAGVLRNIRTDVRSIARAMGVRGGGINAQAAEPRGRQSSAAQAAAGGPRGAHAAMQARDAAGRFVAAAARAATPRRSSRDAVTPGAARAQAREEAMAVARTVAKAAIADRDSRGRFAGKGGPRGGRGGGGGGGGGGSDDDDVPSGMGARVARRLGDVAHAVHGMASGAEQMDPAVAAANEVKEVVAPIGRGLFAMFGTTAERKKERWYKRFLAALTDKRDDGSHAGMAPSDGAGIGAIAGGVARLIPMLLMGLGTILGGGIAALVGTKIGGAIYDWLDKSGIATKIFDAFDAAKAWIEEKVGKAKAIVNGVATNYSTARDIALAGGISRTSGRNLDDPRRLDRPTGFAAEVGRLVGNVKRGWGEATADGARTGAQNRALVTGRQWRAGNIAGLDDAQTRALVASTVSTESDGGKLGVVNKQGYMGRYQAGAGWLADAGLIKGGGSAVSAAMKADGFSRESDWARAGGMSRFLKDDGNWNNGLSYRGYLHSADAQDGAFKTNMDKSYAEMVRKGIIAPGTPMSEVAGLLKARHIAGMGGAATVAAGGVGAADSNGTTARKYFNDVVSDRGGFLSAFSGNAATPGVLRAPGAAGVPSSVPDRLPQAEAVADVPSNAKDKDKPVHAVLREPIGQDVGDRNIAHIVSGGIGG